MIHNNDEIQNISKQCTLASRISSGLVWVVWGEGLIILPVFKIKWTIVAYNYLSCLSCLLSGCIIALCFHGLLYQVCMYVKTITSISPHITFIRLSLTSKFLSWHLWRNHRLIFIVMPVLLLVQCLLFGGSLKDNWFHTQK